MENRVRFLDRENDPDEEIDFAALTEIKTATASSDSFASGFIVGYTLAAATAFAAILMCAR